MDDRLERIKAAILCRTLAYPVAYFLKRAVEKGLAQEVRLEGIEIRGEKISHAKRVFEPASTTALWPEEMRP